MKLIHSAITEVKQVSPKKRVPVHKDEVKIAEFMRSFVNEHNKKIRAKQA